MKINLSITDFPIFSQQETFFKKFKEVGVDGLELVLGIKTRFEYARISYLSEKYNLPIYSIHQPAWSGVGLYFDESFLKFAKKLGVSHIVFHPLAFCSFESRAMKGYFKKLSSLQEKYNFHVMIENMPKDYAYNKLYDESSKNQIENHLEKIFEIAKNYGFLITYDVCHSEIINPVKSNIFKKLLPNVGNIHLSSFTKNKHHLPLTIGEFDTKDFIPFLIEQKYKGLLTFELYFQKLSLVLKDSEFKAIEDSVKIVRDLMNKSK